MPPANDPRPEGRTTGYRFGPFTLVTELRTLPDDPWAHRKGEPRVLALFWAMYLMGGALMTIFGVRSLGAPSPNRFEYGCRAMVLIILVGLCVLWPMVRLSQRPPRRPIRATLADMFALLAPVQAVIWPMPLLTPWSWEVVAGLNLMVLSWTALVGALVAHGSVSPSAAMRTLLMLATVALVGAAPMVMLLGSRAPQAPTWPSMLSPITATLTLTESPGNRAVTMSGARWLAATAPLFVAAAILLVRRPKPIPHRSPNRTPTP